MADLGGQFDANAKENNQSSIVPAGEYDVVLVASERKPTKDNSGALLNCEFKITRGEFQNRSIFHRFNLWLAPSKQQAIDIAKGQFSQFCRAVGVLTPKDSSELHSKRCSVKVNIKDSEFGQQNNIIKFAAVQMQPAQPPGRQPVSSDAIAGATGNPW